jgi:hypothetical protein
MVLQDQKGKLIVAACGKVQQWRDATESEIMAIEEGV